MRQRMRFGDVRAIGAAGLSRLLALCAAGGRQATQGLIPPACTVTPVISGDTAAGSTLTSDGGTFTGSSVVKTYAWYADGVLIAGATASTYVTLEAQIDAAITNKVTGANALGAAVSSASNAIVVEEVVPTYATWDPAYTLNGTASYSDGNKQCISQSGVRSARSSIGKSSGIWAVVMQRTVYGDTSVVGVHRSTFNPDASDMRLTGPSHCYFSSGAFFEDGSGNPGHLPKPATDLDRTLIVVNLNTGEIAYGVNAVMVETPGSLTWFPITSWAGGQTWYFGQAPGGATTKISFFCDPADLTAGEIALIASLGAQPLSE